MARASGSGGNTVRFRKPSFSPRRIPGRLVFADPLGDNVPRPFWNNPMLPMLFLVSALKTGTASVLLGGFLLRYVVVYAGQVARVISF
ncbi:MAG: polysulfide reductase NrfD [Proteobacteria bacterium]|nr:polysulfide reductase NrfD [Pseudomonadota bacterium]